MSKVILGRLEKTDLRNAWNSEAGDFTPWLAEADNLELLGQAIGIELELEAQEKFVGPFRADILCKDVGSDQWVLIENQLERTDHTHLGQLLTYAAGLIPSCEPTENSQCGINGVRRQGQAQPLHYWGVGKPVL